MLLNISHTDNRHRFVAQQQAIHSLWHGLIRRTVLLQAGGRIRADLAAAELEEAASALAVHSGLVTGGAGGSALAKTCACM